MLFHQLSIFCSYHHFLMDVSSSSLAPLHRHPKTSWQRCSGREVVSSWAGSQSLIAMWHKPWVRLPTMHCQALTRPSAHSTSSLTHRGLTSQQCWGEERCGQLLQHGSSTASQPFASYRYQTLKHRTKHIFYNFNLYSVICHISLRS